MAVKFDKAKETKRRKGLKKYNVGKYTFNILQAPLVPMVWAVDKYTDYRYNKCVWNEEKATEILDDVLPKVLEYVAEENAYYYCKEWSVTKLYKGKRKNRMWVNKHIGKLLDYLINEYENENYIKTIEKDYYETWIKFTERG